MTVNVVQAIELAVVAVTTDAASLSQIGVPTQPIRVGNEWFTIEQVAAPTTPPAA